MPKHLLFTLTVLTLCSCPLARPPQDAVEMDVVWRVGHYADDNQQVLMDGNRIYLAEAFAQGAACLDLETGRTLWRMPLTFIPQSNIVKYGNTLYCFEAWYSDIKPWKPPRIAMFTTEGTWLGFLVLPSNKWNMDMFSITLNGHYLYWNCMDDATVNHDTREWEGGIARLDLRTLTYNTVKNQWEGTPEMVLTIDTQEWGWLKRFKGPLVPYGDTLLVSFNKGSEPPERDYQMGRFYEVDALSGKPLRTFSPDGYTGAHPNNLFFSDDKKILYSSDYGGPRAFEWPGGKELWWNKDLMAGGFLTINNGLGYLIGRYQNSSDESNSVYSIDIHTGKELWKSEAFYYTTHSRPMYSNGFLYVFANNGTYLIDSESGKFIGLDPEVRGDAWQIAHVLEYKGDAINRTMNEIMRVKLNYRQDSWGNAVK